MIFLIPVPIVLAASEKMGDFQQKLDELFGNFEVKKGWKFKCFHMLFTILSICSKMLEYGLMIPLDNVLLNASGSSPHFCSAFCSSVLWVWERVQGKSGYGSV